MIGVPIRSVNGVILQAPDYLFGCHERVHHSCRVVDTHTHLVTMRETIIQVTFRQGLPMSIYEDLIQPRHKEGIFCVAEHRFARIG